jgi:hypothetical protein
LRAFGYKKNRTSNVLTEKQKLESTVDNSKTNEGKQTKEDEPNFSGGDDYYNYKLGIQ